ncbi:MAG TPA: hypothetical protein VL096_08895 [Pirellulaceae bacterium]|nr:hypothetical protein [Pirellulaceae bacterium]
MNNAPVYADLVRQAIQQTMLELGYDLGDGVMESILIRQGAYCGRRFQAADGSAVWFVEEAQLKFYDATGAVRHVCPAPSNDTATISLPMPQRAPLRRAA